MRVLLSTIGSRGDVQPMVALALHLRAAGHDAILGIPPGFDDVVGRFELPFLPVGNDPRTGPRKVPGGTSTTAAEQFAALRVAAAGCDVIVGCAAMQIAARSVAEMLSIPYLYAAYSPIALPADQHPTPQAVDQSRRDDQDCRRLWDLDAQWWNATWRDSINAQRVAIGLPPITDARSHVITDRPLLAADPVLAPWPAGASLPVRQTGAWLVPDPRPLSAELEAFLDAGPPPILFGFGSMMKPRTSGTAMLAAAQTLGYRAVILRGWADLRATGTSPDWLSVGETNLQALLPRVAAAVHHGGAGTTTEAMRAGTPQIILPHIFDQPYFAERVAALGIGVRHPNSVPTPESLAEAVDHAISARVASRARDMASAVRADGTEVAARLILDG